MHSDDGYIYPADGSSTEKRYPAPRSMRRDYDGQAYTPQQGNYQQQPGYYQGQPYDSGHAPPARSYQYQQRGLY